MQSVSQMYTQSGSPSRTGTLNRWQTSRYLLLSQDTFRRHCLLHPSLSCVVFSDFSAFNLLLLILLLFSPPSLGCDLFVATSAYILAFFSGSAGFLIARAWFCQNPPPFVIFATTYNRVCCQF